MSITVLFTEATARRRIGSEAAAGRTSGPGGIHLLNGLYDTKLD
jgi:hypothetical protein